MLKIFIAFITKEVYHILRDTRTLVILFGMPLALVFIFGYTVTTEFRGASMTILDEAKDELSNDLIQHIQASGHFELITTVSNIQELEADFKSNKVKVGIVIPSNFEEDFFKHKAAKVQIITDGTEPNYATTLTSYASRMIYDFQNEQSKITMIPYQINTEIRMRYNPKLVGAYNFIPGVVALILMLTCAMMTSLTIAKEKELGTMDLLLASPLPPLIIIIGKVTPYAILSFISAIMVFTVGYFVFKVPILGSLVLLLTLTLLYLLVALALGIFISTKASNQQIAMVVSLFALLLPTMLLSGFIFPIESMPSILQYLSKIVPAKYFIIIEKAIMLKGVGWESIFQPSSVLLIMFLVLILATWKNFKVIYK